MPPHMQPICPQHTVPLCLHGLPSAPSPSVQVKEDKFSGDSVVTGVDRKHAKYQAFVPHKTRAAPGAGAGGQTGAGAGAGPASGELLIEEVFKVGKELRPVFLEVQADPDALYTGGALC
jgi:translation initiation factor 2D